MKPIPTPTNVVPALRAMHDRLNDGWANVDDAWWTSEAAIIIERLVKERDDARTEARALEQQLDAAVADHKRVLAALEETARESYKGVTDAT